MGRARIVRKALGPVSGWTGADWRQGSEVCQRLGSLAGVGQGRKLVLKGSEEGKGAAGLRDSLEREERRHRVKRHFQPFNPGEVTQ